MAEEKNDVLKYEKESEINEAYKEDKDIDFNGHDGVSEEELMKVIKKLSDDIASLEAANTEYLNALQRERADYKNLKARSQTAASEAYKSGIADTIVAVLPVMDSFERAIAALPEESNEDALAKGVLMVYRQLKDILAGMGLKEICAEGECFDPNFHHAMFREDAEEGEKEGDIKEVLIKGYMLNDKVLRHSAVKVAGNKKEE